MAKKKIAIIFGGKSGEHEVSIVSAMNIFKALDRTKYDVTLIGIDRGGRWYQQDEKHLLAQSDHARQIEVSKNSKPTTMLPFPVEAGQNQNQIGGAMTTLQKFDVVLPILHGTYGEDGTIQGLLELAQVPYVGSGVLGSSVGMDKDMTKRVLRDAGVPVVPFVTIRKSEFQRNPSHWIQLLADQFSYPYFVKPANMGSSVGIHKVKTKEEAMRLIEDSFQYDVKILVEKAINARELEIAVLGNDDPKASIVGEIVPTHEFYTYEAKYLDENGAALHIPAKNLTDEQVRTLQSLAIKTFKALDCFGLARVDFFMDKITGDIYLNEVNTMPGFTQISMYPKLWQASGIGYSQLIDQLIQLALERYEQKAKLKTEFEG